MCKKSVIFDKLKKFAMKVAKHLEMRTISTFGRSNFGGKDNLPLERANRLLYEKIVEGKPFAVIRMGFSELDLLYDVDANCKYPKYKPQYAFWLKLLDSDENIKRYHQLVIDAYRVSDVIASWYSSRNEAALIQNYGKDASITDARVVEPYYFSEPWSKALEGKTVLVVSPFSDVISSQYEKRQLLFSNEVLPQMTLRTLDSVWYVPGGKDERFENWFEALDYLKAEIEEIDFDVALLGCGPFGTPLVEYIKGMGKQAIYIGGAIQILFGIKGKRWDNNSDISKLYNENWIYLPDSSIPKNGKSLDNGCYWK